MRLSFIIFIFIRISSISAQTISLEGIIDLDRAGQIILGESLENTLKRMENITVIYTDHGSSKIFSDTNEVLTIGSKKQNGKIDYIEIKSPKFETRLGLKTGMSIEQITGIYPSIKVNLDETSGETYIAPYELQNYNGSKPESLCLFYLETNESSETINFVLNELNQTFEADLKGNTGKIKYIRIYKWE